MTWQPMGTAPKDGTYIIVAFSLGKDMLFTTEAQCVKDWGWWNGSLIRGDAVAWQPLLGPPTPEELQKLGVKL